MVSLSTLAEIALVSGQQGGMSFEVVVYEVNKDTDFSEDDGWRRSFVSYSLRALMEYEGDDAGAADLDADMLGVLTDRWPAWIGSHPDRAGYCDEALEAYGIDAKGQTAYLSFGGTEALLRAGLLLEAVEVHRRVVRYLKDPTR